MIRQIAHVVGECPVCGRPVEIQSEHLGRTVVCQHCGGAFLANENGSPAREWVARCERLLIRPDPFLKTSASLAVDRRSTGERRCRQILLVEHRDDVFARLAAELTEAGFRVVRAVTAWGAMRHYPKQPFTLVLANLTLPDQSGWLLAAKLHLVDPTAVIWLYEPCRPSNDAAMAEFLGVEELFESWGDPLRLVHAVVDQLAERFGGRPASRSNHGKGGEHREETRCRVHPL